MKKLLLSIVALSSILTLNAQEQSGVIKTIGRPDQPGKPLGDVLIRANEVMSATTSDENGNFSIILSHYKEGQAYSLSNVSKIGYQLADAGVIGRQYPYSESIPLEISMISKKDYLAVKSQIENSVRERVDAEYQTKFAALQEQLKKKSINEEEYRNKLQELNEYYEKTENLIDQLADRYARTDYDYLNAVDAQINSLIEKGELEQAEKLIESKGTKKALEQLRSNNAKLEQTLEEGRQAEAKMLQNYASELLMQFNIAAIRFDNHRAAQYLKERMELDPKNFEWTNEYATFIREFLGMYDQAMSIYDKLLSQELNIDERATVYGNMGSVYEITSDLDKALEYYKKSAELRESNLEMYESDLAVNYSNMATVYAQKEMYPEAQEYIAKAEKIYTKYTDTEGLSHVYNTQAKIYADFGDFARAEEMLIKVLDIRRSLYGDIHHKVANTYENLSVLMKRLDRYSEAMDYAQKALDITIKIFGDNHPTVADCYVVLCSIEQAAKNKNEEQIISYCNKALQIYNKFYGEEHYRIAEVYNRLASYYNSVNIDLKKSLDYYTKSYVMLEKIYGKNHSSVANELNNVAFMRGELGEYEKAVELYHEVLNIQRDIYGAEHYKVGETYNNIASELYMLGKYDESQKYYELSLDICIKSYGKNHSNIGLAYFNLSSIYQKKDDWKKALEYAEQAKDIYVAIYGNNHSKIANVYDRMGSIYDDLRIYDKAEVYILKALKIREELYADKKHIAFGTSYNNLGELYSFTGNYAEAEKYLLMSLDIQREHYGEVHDNIATALSNLALLHQKQKKYDKALEYMLAAYEMSQKCFDIHHPTVCLYRYGLGNMYFITKQYEKAFPLIMEEYLNAYKTRGIESKYTKHYLEFSLFIYTKILAQNKENTLYDECIQKIRPNMIVGATVTKGSPAEQRGLSGDYYIIQYNDWSIDDEMNYFRYHAIEKPMEKNRYVLYRDGEFISVPFEGKLGVAIGPMIISAEDKEVIVKSAKKWLRKNR